VHHVIIRVGIPGALNMSQPVVGRSSRKAERIARENLFELIKEGTHKSIDVPILTPRRLSCYGYLFTLDRRLSMGEPFTFKKL
jgi:hypothetical protein